MNIIITLIVIFITIVALNIPLMAPIIITSLMKELLWPQKDIPSFVIFIAAIWYFEWGLACSNMGILPYLQELAIQYHSIILSLSKTTKFVLDSTSFFQATMFTSTLLSFFIAAIFLFIFTLEEY